MAVLSKCDYICSNDIILKSKWCDYVPKQSHEQQGRFRYICENQTPLVKPTASIASSYQSGNGFCVVLETNIIGNKFTLVFENGYSKEIVSTALSTTVCVEYARIGNSGTVTITPESVLEVTGTAVTVTYEKIIVSIPILFYPLTQKLWGKIVANKNTDIEIWADGDKLDSYSTGTTDLERYFHSPLLTANTGNIIVKAIKGSSTVEIKRGFNKNDWNEIKVTPTTTKILNDGNEIKVSLSSTITRTYFDGVDYPDGSIDKIGVK
jgi:hypothetical protein